MTSDTLRRLLISVRRLNESSRIGDTRGMRAETACIEMITSDLCARIERSQPESDPTERIKHSGTWWQDTVRVVDLDVDLDLDLDTRIPELLSSSGVAFRPNRMIETLSHMSSGTICHTVELRGPVMYQDDTEHLTRSDGVTWQIRHPGGQFTTLYGVYRAFPPELLRFVAGYDVMNSKVFA